VTAFLSQQFSRYLPKVVAIRTEWNAWIMEEAGRSLHSSDQLVQFEQAVGALASLQKAAVGRTKELLAAGCGDHSMAELDGRIDEVIGYLTEIMQHQTSTKDDLRIPDSLMHHDISPGSMLSDGSSCVFTDWCEAYIDNPFIIF